MVRLGLAALLCTCLFAATSFAADPTGTWRWEHQSSETQEMVKNVLTIQIEGGKVTGTYQGEGDPVEILDGKIDGDKLSWAFDTDADGTQIHVAFRGIVSGDDVTGTVTLGDFGEFPWTAKRDVKQENLKAGNFSGTNPSGTWRWTHDQDGQTIEDVLTIVFDGKSVSGTYHSGDDIHEIENAQIQDDTLSWEFNADVDGNTLNVAFHGAIEGDDVVDGTVTIAGVGEFPWTAKRDEGSMTAVSAAEPAEPTVADMLRELDVPDSVIASVQDWSSLPAHIRVTIEALLEGELDRAKQAKQRERRAKDRQERERKKREDQ